MSEVIEKSVELTIQSAEQEVQPPAPMGNQAFGDIMINEAMLTQAAKLAEWMASAKVTVPKHLLNSVGDCYAIVLQSLQWRMNPFVVAQKTHLVNGTLGYEAQLVNAVLQSSGAIRGRFHYEHRGEGAALETRVGAVPAGETDLVWGEWLKSSDVTTKNSPLWKTNPKQQMGYLQVKNWARAYKPAALLGVYTVDELTDSPPRERDITPQTPSEVGAAAMPQAQGVDRETLIKDLVVVARTKGPEPFKEAWKALSVEEKAAIGIPERDRIKQLADMAFAPDADVSDDTQQQDAAE